MSSCTSIQLCRTSQAAANGMIQPEAADKTNTAILKIDEEIRRKRGRWGKYGGMWGNCHDYVGLYAPESAADEAIELVERCMTSEDRGMKYPCDRAKATRYWSEQ